ncbi:TetR/AcrR family transcriptional regulator [Brevibacterium album]|uniref:TetR/AcrR family transcriptional regulator n=1 Tax=Brevibacterium album TaxID=417948 RepID=UPI00048CBB2E|nr:TetR/AcrR family transcriptional regulator [Brevibacterium album]
MDWEARKAQLAEAVWEVILDQGVSAVSVRTVAERAGVVVGSLRHVFPSRSELVLFSAELMVQRATERILSTPPRSDPRERAFAIIRNVLPLTPESRAEYEVNLALVAERPVIPELHEVRNRAHQRLSALSAQIVESLTERAGAPFVRSRARRLHALIDGLAFHLFHQSPDVDPGWALDIVRSELDDIAALSSENVRSDQEA